MLALLLDLLALKAALEGHIDLGQLASKSDLLPLYAAILFKWDDTARMIKTTKRTTVASYAAVVQAL